jgi:LCP family protein required for cell wall assembly
MQMNFNIKRLKRQVLSNVKLVRFISLSVILVIVIFCGVISYKAISKTSFGTAVTLAYDFAFPSTTNIKTNDNRINILLLGKGGTGHDAPDLTDTMILVSLSTRNSKMTLISIPRDIWDPTLRDKINSAYMKGQQKQPNGGGMILAKSTVETVIGVPVNYAMVIDFGGFKDVIDVLGGIQLDVKNGFTDPQYPIAGHEDDPCLKCRYETITFKSGIQTMNGETALKFVRSRHASGTEGNDIARGARQQLVIAAIIKRLLTPQVFTDLDVDKHLLKIGQGNIETDMKLSEEATLARYVVNARASFRSYSIPDNLLYNPPNEYKYFNSLYTHAFVFVPSAKDGSWNDVQKWVQSVLP